MQPWGVVGSGPKKERLPVDRGFGFVHQVDPAHPAESQKEETDALVAARSDDPSKYSCPEYMTCPGLELANAQKTLAAVRLILQRRNARGIGAPRC